MIPDENRRNAGIGVRERPRSRREDECGPPKRQPLRNQREIAMSEGGFAPGEEWNERRAEESL